jgi:hypothetical protein
MNIEAFLQQYAHIWKTKSVLMAWIRGNIRRSMWNNAPQKVEFMRKNRIRIPNPNPNGRVQEVWGAKCSITGQVFPLSEMQVDHLKGNNSLNSLDDIPAFIENVVLVGDGDIQWVSKEAHKIKSYAEKQGIPYNPAAAQKTAIKIVKEKQDVAWLNERGIIPASTQAKRREQIVQCITQGEKQ